MNPFDPRLLRYSRSSRGFISLIIGIAVFNAALTVIQAIVLAKIIVSIFQRHTSIHLTSTLILVLLALYLARSLLNFFGEWISSLASTRIRNELRSALMAAALTGGSSQAQRFGSSRISVLATSGINTLDGYFAKFLPQLFIALIVPISVGFVITLKDWKTGLIILATIPLIPLFGILIGRFTAAATHKRWQTLGIMSGYFLDLLNGISTLKVYNRAHLQDAKIKSVGDQHRKGTMGVLKISFLSSLALELIATLSVALIAVSIGLRLVSGSLALETGLMVLILAPDVYWPIRQVSAHFHAAADGIHVFNSIYSILDTPAVNGHAIVTDVLAVTWSHLEVRYSDRSIIEIPAGQIVRGQVHAIVGPSGSGKSTLIKVLLGFIQPTSGEVLVTTPDGTYPLLDIDLKSWRSLIGWLPQEPHFPIETVAGALQDARSESNHQEMISVFASVGLNMNELKNGLQTSLGSNKDPLSVGQLRKVALARAINKEAVFLILDEPSASVDGVSEEIIQQLITSEAESGKIVLVISHRPLLVEKAASTTVITQVGP